MEGKLKEKDENMKQMKEIHENEIEMIQRNGKSIEQQMNQLQIRLQVSFSFNQRQKRSFDSFRKM